MPHGPEKFVVEASFPLERLDVFLRARLPDFSRAAIQRLLADGHIRVNGQTVKPARTVRAPAKPSPSSARRRA